MATRQDPYQAEPEDHACTTELQDEEGRSYAVCQEAVGADRVVGGGEFPDPATPARAPAPGIAGQVEAGPERAPARDMWAGDERAGEEWADEAGPSHDEVRH